jgi:chromosome segregation ATPase
MNKSILRTACICLGLTSAILVTIVAVYVLRGTGSSGRQSPGTPPADGAAESEPMAASDLISTAKLAIRSAEDEIRAADVTIRAAEDRIRAAEKEVPVNQETIRAALEEIKSAQDEMRAPQERIQTALKQIQAAQKTSQ